MQAPVERQRITLPAGAEVGVGQRRLDRVNHVGVACAVEDLQGALQDLRVPGRPPQHSLHQPLGAVTISGCNQAIDGREDLVLGQRHLPRLQHDVPVQLHDAGVLANFGEQLFKQHASAPVRSRLDERTRQRLPQLRRPPPLAKR